MGSISKRQKLFKAVNLKETEDRISNLPNSLIGHILSFLPTKCAVRTSILSTKWKQMWTLISNLDFDSSQISHPPQSNADQCEKSFVKFVYRVLLLLKVSSVNKFRLSYSGTSVNVNDWVSAALSRNGREIDLSLNVGWSDLLPSDLFTCNTLVILKLRFVALSVPNLVCLQSLKTLHLESAEFRDDESRKRLFCSCPMLEDLVLIYCAWENFLSISAPALKSLIIDCVTWYDCTEVPGYRFELNAPSLLYLKYVEYVAEGYAMKNLHSLGRAHIDLGSSMDRLEVRRSVYGISAAKLFQGISNVHSLQLTGDSIEALYLCRCKLPVLHNLTSLELGVSMVGWQLLPDLLESSPQLRTLVFEEGLLRTEFSMEYTLKWDPPQRVPACLLFRLNIIDLGSFEGRQDELKIVEYFLKNAKVLKTLRISMQLFGNKEDQLEIAQAVGLFLLAISLSTYTYDQDNDYSEELLICLVDFIGRWVVTVEIDDLGGKLGGFVWWISLVVEAAIGGTW
ncbi:unnamed protein product [Ilex paraguariensis]|uniref:FBD domain-containing protein n=1 Tax=Ilex paraguariensis TaxID=185542 RepID=A0ABC8U764_9AQUA